MAVYVVDSDPFAAGGAPAPDMASPQAAPAPEPAPASTSAKGKTEPEAPAAARDELMRVLFADGVAVPGMDVSGFRGAANTAHDELRQKARESRKPYYDEAYAQG